MISLKLYEARFKEIFKKILITHTNRLTNEKKSDGQKQSKILVNRDDESIDSMASLATKNLFDELENRYRDADIVIKHSHIYDLYKNLKMPHNVNLLLKVVLGEITCNELCEMDIKDLAPEETKKRRKIEAEKYFKEKVIISELDASKICSSTLSSQIVDNTTTKNVDLSKNQLSIDNFFQFVDTTFGSNDYTNIFSNIVKKIDPELFETFDLKINTEEENDFIKKFFLNIYYNPSNFYKEPVLKRISSRSMWLKENSKSEVL